MSADTTPTIDLLKRAFWIVKSKEWAYQHAAENRYCTECQNETDYWGDQKEHHEGCEWVQLVGDLRDALMELGVSV